MDIEHTSKYKRELKKVLKSPNITLDKVNTTIQTFINEPNHNSLDSKNIKGCSNYINLYQIRLTSDYRILFELMDDYILLRHIGNHNYIEKHTKNC